MSPRMFSRLETSATDVQSAECAVIVEVLMGNPLDVLACITSERSGRRHYRRNIDSR
jgi:hypothetical protein